MNIHKSLYKIVRERENRKKRLILNLLVLANVFILGILVGGFFTQNEILITGQVTGNLPDVGESNWGTILNNFLLQEHTTNGTHGNVTAEEINVSGNITTSSYFGAGTQNPGSPLDVISENIRGIRIQEEDLSSHFEIYVNPSGTLNFLRGSSSFAMGITNANRVGIEDSTPDAQFEVQHSGTGDAFRVDDQANDPTPFLINQDGEVGIGTISPSTKLDVNGSIVIESLPGFFYAATSGPADTCNNLCGADDSAKGFNGSSGTCIAAWTPSKVQDLCSSAYTDGFCLCAGVI